MSEVEIDEAGKSDENGENLMKSEENLTKSGENDTRLTEDNEIDVKVKTDKIDEINQRDENVEEKDEEDEEEEEEIKVHDYSKVLPESTKRKRKSVEFFHNTETPRSVLKARKTSELLNMIDSNELKLIDIPEIASNIDKFTGSSPELKLLHVLMFKTPGRKTEVKKDVRLFSGLKYDITDEKLNERLQRENSNLLKTICDILILDRKGTTEKVALADLIIKFLREPKKPEIENKMAMQKRQRSKSKTPAKKRKSTAKKGAKEGDEDEDGKTEDEDAEDTKVAEKKEKPKSAKKAQKPKKEAASKAKELREKLEKRIEEVVKENINSDVAAINKLLRKEFNAETVKMKAKFIRKMFLKYTPATDGSAVAEKSEEGSKAEEMEKEGTGVNGADGDDKDDKTEDDDSAPEAKDEADQGIPNSKPEDSAAGDKMEEDTNADATVETDNN